MCPAAEVWQHREDPFWRSLDRSGTVEISQSFDYLQVPQRCSGKVSFRCKGCKFELVRASALVLNTGRTSPVNETKSWSSEEWIHWVFWGDRNVYEFPMSRIPIGLSQYFYMFFAMNLASYCLGHCGQGTRGSRNPIWGQPPKVVNSGNPHISKYFGTKKKWIGCWPGHFEVLWDIWGMNMIEA
jgi:hypothetical protein